MSHRLGASKERYSKLLSNSPLSQGNVIAPAWDTPPDVLPLSVHMQSKTAMKVLVLQIATAFRAVSKSDYTIRSLCEGGLREREECGLIMQKIYCRLSWLLRDDIFFSGAADGKV